MTQTLPPVRTGFDDAQRATAARLYWQAFKGKLGRLLGPDEKALAFLAPILDPSHCVSISGADGRLLGVAGFRTNNGAFVGGEWADLRRVYGGIGAAWRAPLLSVLERPVQPGLLLMDGIAVAPEARGQGIGTQLLRAIVAQAEAQGATGVRLDVIDTNPRARALYERFGFEARGTEDAFPFRWLFRFRNATRMELPLGARRSDAP